MIKKAQMSWTGGMQFVGHGESGHAIITDAGHDNGGQDTGPRPGELPLLALAACTGIDIVTILSKMKIAISSLNVEVEAEPVDQYPKTWREIRVKYKIGGDVPEKKLQEAIRLSHEKYCSVGAVLGASAKMSFTYEILPPPPPPPSTMTETSA